MHSHQKTHSCKTQLLTIHNLLKQQNPKRQVHVDLIKAFDTVSHKRLLNKLWIYRLVGGLLRWIAAFLSNRQQQALCDRINLGRPASHLEYHKGEYWGYWCFSTPRKRYADWHRPRNNAPVVWRRCPHIQSHQQYTRSRDIAVWSDSTRKLGSDIGNGVQRIQVLYDASTLTYFPPTTWEVPGGSIFDMTSNRLNT
jgi:hypothetical protein